MLAGNSSISKMDEPPVIRKHRATAATERKVCNLRVQKVSNYENVGIRYYCK